MTWLVIIGLVVWMLADPESFGFAIGLVLLVGWWLFCVAALALMVFVVHGI